MVRSRGGKKKKAAMFFSKITRGHFGRLKAAQRSVELQKELARKREEEARIARELAEKAAAGREC